MCEPTPKIVTLQKMPAPDWSVPFEKRGKEYFERGERVILVDGVRWGRTRVKSRGSRGNRMTFHQDGGDMVMRELRPGKFVDVYVDSTSERSALQFIGGKYQLPPDFKGTEQLVLEKARELVASGLLRDPEIVKAEVAERQQKHGSRSRPSAQAREDEAFRARAIIAVMLPCDHPDFTLAVDKIVEAMRWAQDK